MGKMGTTPLIRALLKRDRMKTVPLHMPGHKRGSGISPGFAQLMQANPFSLDMTELPGLDDLHNPTGPIRDAQSHAASLFGADRTFFLINGSTVGLHAAIMAVCGQGGEILLPRDAHKSVIGACILCGAVPRYLPVRLNKEFMVPYPPTPGEVAKALVDYPAVKAVIQVYPTYFGLTGDLAAISKTAHDHGIPVIVDEAHGAHFRFSPRLPVPALDAGADLVVQSTHKTLGALTQASMLHLKSRLLDYNNVARQLGIIQSTSPSYILMASLDAAAGDLSYRGITLLQKAVNVAERARSEIEKIPGIRCLDLTGDNGVIATDPTKLYISLRGIGLTGVAAAKMLLSKYHIQVEFSDLIGILCMFSLGNTTADADKLVSALRQIGRERSMASSRKRAGLPNVTLGSLPHPIVVQSPREAWFSPTKQVLLNGAVGRVAAEIVAPYPPGIPILCPGEEITIEVVETIRSLKAGKILFHGPADRSLEYVTVVDC